MSAAGKRLLRDGWLALIEAGPKGDLDSDLRVALLTIWSGGDRRIALDFLRQSAEKKMESIADTRLTGGTGEFVPLARWYTDLRSATAKALLAAESEAIRAMADSLPRSLSSKSRRKPKALKAPETVL